MVSTLVSGIPVTHVDSYLPSVYWNDEYRNCADIAGWGRIDEQKVVPFLEVFFPQAVCSAIGFRSFSSQKILQFDSGCFLVSGASLGHVVLLGPSVELGASPRYGDYGISCPGEPIGRSGG